MERNYKFLSMQPLPAYVTPPLLILFASVKNTGCANKVAKRSKKATENQPSSFCISCFTVSVTPSVNTSEPYNDFMILIVEINKVNSFLALTTHIPLIFLSNLFIAFIHSNYLLIQVNYL